MKNICFLNDGRKSMRTSPIRIFLLTNLKRSVLLLHSCVTGPQKRNSPVFCLIFKVKSIIIAINNSYDKIILSAGAYGRNLQRGVDI